MKQPLNLSKEEKDLLLDLLLEKVLEMNNMNSVMQQQLEKYRQDILGIYSKVVDSMDED